MTTHIAAITLPANIHAAILTRRDAVTGEMVSRGVVWADRTYPACETCGEPVPREPACPVVINEGDGKGSQLMEWSQRHADIGGSCGFWQPVLWAECGTSEDEITAAADALAADRAAVLEAGRLLVVQRLNRELSDALERAAGPASEDRGGITTGSDTQPGIYFDEHGSGQWIAWDYDPDDDSGAITVYASDLAA